MFIVYSIYILESNINPYRYLASTLLKLINLYWYLTDITDT